MERLRAEHAAAEQKVQHSAATRVQAQERRRAARERAAAERANRVFSLAGFDARMTSAFLTLDADAAGVVDDGISRERLLFLIKSNPRAQEEPAQDALSFFNVSSSASGEQACSGDVDMVKNEEWANFFRHLIRLRGEAEAMSALTWFEILADRGREDE